MENKYVQKLSLKRVQRRMAELGLCAITVKKYKPYSSKKVAEGLENVLKKILLLILLMKNG